MRNCCSLKPKETNSSALSNCIKRSGVAGSHPAPIRSPISVQTINEKRFTLADFFCVGKEDSATTELPTTEKLAYERTRLAHERTMMAWIRTANALLAFGFGSTNF